MSVTKMITLEQLTDSRTPVNGPAIISESDLALAIHAMSSHAKLVARVKELEEVVEKASSLAGCDRWPERHPRIYGAMEAALANKERE